MGKIDTQTICFFVKQIIINDFIKAIASVKQKRGAMAITYSFIRTKNKIKRMSI